MVKDTAPPHRFGPGHDLLGNRGGSTPSILDYVKNNPVRTQRPTRADHSVARELLAIANKHKIGETTFTEYGNAVETTLVLNGMKAALEEIVDKRPLIDRVHEATFTNPVGIQWIEDKYALRGLLRKAHCFTVDDATSELIADFSLAIGHDLDTARRMAIPPFPVTWIDINNAKRLARIKSFGVPLTESAQGIKDGSVVERVGWLIHPAEIGGHFLTYFTEVEQGVMMAPLSFWWHNNEARPIPMDDRDPEMDKYLQFLTHGVKDGNCDSCDAYPSPTPMHIKLKKNYSGQVRDLMKEVAGELRHVWGFLIAIGSAQFGMTPQTAAQPLHTDIRKMPNGKPLLPLEHKTLHLHLRRSVVPTKALLRAMTKHRMRHHDVRGHWRMLKNPDGTLRKRVPVKPHERGDKLLGRIEKTYTVKK